MKKTVVSIICSLFAVMAAAQSVNGLELGSYYSKDMIHALLSRALESTADDGMFVFTSGESKFYFDFTGAFESNDGRFVDAAVYDPDHIVEFPFGEFRVGDSLTRLLYLRANVQMVDTEESFCTVSYVKGTRKMAVRIELDEEMNVAGALNFTAGKVEKDVRMERGPFYAAVPSVRVGTVVIKAGDPLSKLLTLHADVNFTGLHNGVCKITTGGWKPVSYLVRYDLDHIVKEILPL